MPASLNLLAAHEAGEEARLVSQFFEAALLHDFAFFNHVDPVGLADGAESVSDYDACGFEAA